MNNKEKTSYEINPFWYGIVFACAFDNHILDRESFIYEFSKLGFFQNIASLAFVSAALFYLLRPICKLVGSKIFNKKSVE